ncbi:MAG: L,D-transpeptidase [Candidatus Dojkabacteria bacterium]|nr:MAG: L,D-transpeptidase [Candidatus Dojkabacteria bacterium]
MYQAVPLSRVHVFILTLGIFFFLGAVAFLISSIIPVEQSFNPVIAAVQGEKTVASCSPETHSKERFLASAPTIRVIAGGNIAEISFETLSLCISFEQQSLQCPNDTQFSIDNLCVQRRLEQQEALFPQYIEITGLKQKVSVKKQDWAINFEVLAEQVGEQFSNAYQLVHSGKDLDRKTLTIQAPLRISEPSTDGTFAQKYIEVDGSRQLMFLWENGKYRTFSVSGALQGYNPVGIHKVLNKSKLAWSSTANKWMPYWMAFMYDPSQKTMLGIHSLVYWFPGYQPTGEYVIREPESNVGTPRSTGCIRLKEDEAKLVYDWANVGDWVIVHE